MEQLTFIDGMKPEEPKTKKDWVGGFRSVVGCLGASNHTKEEREENDYYATDPEAMEWLLKLENIGPEVWEPACGGGHLSKVMEAHGLKVRSTDLINRGYGEGGVDFLKTTDKWPGDIVTNPPYKYAQEFIEHALAIAEDGAKICMFLKVQFLEGKTRRRLYDTTPPRTVWVSSSRITCYKNGSDTQNSMIAYAWYVWEKGYTGTTELRWFN